MQGPLRDRELRGYMPGRGYTDLNMRKLALSRELRSHGGCVNAVCWSSDGALLATGSDDTKIVLWNANRNFISKSVSTMHEANIFSVRFLPETRNHIVASGSLDGLVQCTDVTTTDGSALSTYDHHRGAVKKVVPLPLESNTFLTCGEDGGIGTVDRRARHASIVTQLFQKRGSALAGEVHGMALADLKPWLLAVGTGAGDVFVLDRRQLPAVLAPLGRNRAGPYAPLDAASVPHDFSGLALGDMVTGVAFSYDGTEVLASYSAGHTYAFNLTPQCLQERAAHESDSALRRIPVYGYSTPSFHVEDPAAFLDKLEKEAVDSVPPEARERLMHAFLSNDERELLSLAGAYSSDPLYRILDSIPWEEGSMPGGDSDGNGSDSDPYLGLGDLMDTPPDSEGEFYDSDGDIDGSDDDPDLSPDAMDNLLGAGLHQRLEGAYLDLEEEDDEDEEDPDFDFEDEEEEDEQFEAYSDEDDSLPTSALDNVFSEELRGDDDEGGDSLQDLIAADAHDSMAHDPSESQDDGPPLSSASEHLYESPPPSDSDGARYGGDSSGPSWDVGGHSDPDSDSMGSWSSDPWGYGSDPSDDDGAFDPFDDRAPAAAAEYTSKELLEQEAKEDAIKRAQWAEQPSTSALSPEEAALSEAHAVEIATNLCVALNRSASQDPFGRNQFSRGDALATRALDASCARRMRLAVEKVSAWLKSTAERAILAEKILPLARDPEDAPGAAPARRMGPGAVSDDERAVDDLQVKTFTGVSCDALHHQDDCSACFARWAIRGPWAGSDAPLSLPFRMAYLGAANQHTVKDVCLLGPRSEYVAAGSDNGMLMIWDRTTGRLLNALAGDRRVVNGAVGHPNLPLIASYGIDRTVKLWSPLAEFARPVTALVQPIMSVHQRCILGG